MAVSNNPSLWRSKMPVLPADGHKYERGCAVVFGGEMTGAARLAAAASMRMGAGLCVLAVPPKFAPVYSAAVPPHIIVESFRNVRETLSDERRNAVLIGPGLGDGKRAMILSVIHSARPVVVDADAITRFEDDPGKLLKTIPPHCVLTPHEGEFARLFPNIKGGRVERAVAAAGQAGCTVVLKGAHTVIAAPNVEPVVNEIEAPMLATAGSGDVLAGMITGLLAQRMEPFSAACAAVYMHAMAGHMFGPGLVASDLPDMIPAVFREVLR